MIIPENTDFGVLLSHRQSSGPSFVLLRSIEPITPQQQAMLLTANLPTVEKDLLEARSLCSPVDGCVRRLPIGHE